MAVYGHASMELRETDCRQWPCSHVIKDTCRYHWSSKPVVLLRRGCNSVLRASVLISPHIFRRRWRHSTRISCFIHGCGLRDRCPSCHRGITAFAQPRLVGQHVCTSCAYDLRRASKVPVTIEAQYFEQIINRSIGTVANILATNNPPKWPWRRDLIAVLPTRFPAGYACSSASFPTTPIWMRASSFPFGGQSGL